MGLFEVADGGTIFLDEIGELPLALQPKLLTFLETGEVMKVGSVKAKKVDCRVIAATNKDLKKMVKEKLFREDLYYRLSVIPVEIPPLRDRREDIIPLVLFFLKRDKRKDPHKQDHEPGAPPHAGSRGMEGKRPAAQEYGGAACGNERQERDNGGRYTSGWSIERDMGAATRPELPVSLPEIVGNVEDRYIEKAMKEGGSIRKAAALLGISPASLYRRMNRNE